MLILRSSDVQCEKLLYQNPGFCALIVVIMKLLNLTIKSKFNKNSVKSQTKSNHNIPVTIRIMQSNASNFGSHMMFLFCWWGTETFHICVGYIVTRPVIISGTWAYNKSYWGLRMLILRWMYVVQENSIFVLHFYMEEFEWHLL